MIVRLQDKMKQHYIIYYMGFAMSCLFSTQVPSSSIFRIITTVNTIKKMCSLVALLFTTSFEILHRSLEKDNHICFFLFVIINIFSCDVTCCNLGRDETVIS